MTSDCVRCGDAADVGAALYFDAEQETDGSGYTPLNLCDDCADKLADQARADSAGGDGHLSSADAWEQFETLVWSHALAPRRADVADALHALEERVRDQERPTADEVQEARRALDRARALVEDQYADLADGVGPWDDGAGVTVPHGALVSQLEDSGYSVRSPGEEPVVDLADEHGRVERDEQGT